MRDVLARQTSEAYGASFLAKIVQVPVQLPAVDPARLRALVTAEAARVAEAAGVDPEPVRALGRDRIWPAPDYDRLVAPRVRTLRDAHRLLNAFRFALLTSDRTPDLHAGDLLLLCLLQAFHPAVYAGVRTRRAFLLGADAPWRQLFAGRAGREADLIGRRAELLAIARGERADAPPAVFQEPGVPEWVPVLGRGATGGTQDGAEPPGGPGEGAPTVRRSRRSPSRCCGACSPGPRLVAGSAMTTIGNGNAQRTAFRPTTASTATSGWPRRRMTSPGRWRTGSSPSSRRAGRPRARGHPRPNWTREERRRGRSPKRRPWLTRSPPCSRVTATRSARRSGPRSATARWDSGWSRPGRSPPTRPRVVARAPTLGLLRAVHHAARALVRGARARAHDGRIEAVDDVSAAEAMLVKVVDALPALPDALRFADDYAAERAGVARLPDAVRRRVAAAGAERARRDTAGVPSLVDAFGVDGACHVWWDWPDLLRARDGGAPDTPVGTPLPDIQAFTAAVLTAGPARAVEVLALCSGWREDAPTLRHGTELAKVVARVRETTDPDRLTALLARAEAGEFGPVRWAHLLPDYRERVLPLLNAPPGEGAVPDPEAGQDDPEDASVGGDGAAQQTP